MGASAQRLAQLRDQIATGTYAPESEAVTEAVLAWVVPASWFDTDPAWPDRIKSPDPTVEGPLDRPGAGAETAGDPDPRDSYPRR